jgi:hypothetical protein
MFILFEDVLQEGRFSEYVVVNNATLFTDFDHPW